VTKVGEVVGIAGISGWAVPGHIDLADHVHCARQMGAHRAACGVAILCADGVHPVCMLGHRFLYWGVWRCRDWQRNAHARDQKRS
jgi:hypothetical protein